MLSSDECGNEDGLIKEMRKGMRNGEMECNSGSGGKHREPEERYKR
jgi:hypothetical protein